MDPAIKEYIDNGRVAWGPGYKPYRRGHLLSALRNELGEHDALREGKPPSDEYAFGLDERLIEYPWVLSRLSSGEGRLLDAGSTFNYPYIFKLPQVANKELTILTLAPEKQYEHPDVSYHYGDLRDCSLRDNWFDEVICISTLEHVGLDNTRLYTEDGSFRESALGDFRSVLRELKRVLKPGGRLYLTVPFGRAANLGWMQQFDCEGIEAIVTAFGSKCLEQQFYRHGAQGWERAKAVECAELDYFDVHSATEPAEDHAAAARAVACLTFEKPALPAVKRPQISAVLGSYNRLPLLKQTIKSIRSERSRGVSVEIIVVDGGSTDGSIVWLAAQKDIVTITQHNRGEIDGEPVKRRSWGYFMNLAFKASQGTYILMVSDDCLLLPDAVTQGVACAEGGLAQGRKIGAVAFYYRNWPQEENYYVQRTLGGKLMLNHGLFVRDALEQVGWADEDTYLFYKADGDLCLRLWEEGFEIVDSLESRVEHYFDPAESVRQSNDTTWDADRKAYVERWRNIFFHPGVEEKRGKLISDYADPEETADRVFGQVNAEFLKFPRTEEKWSKWLNASRPNLPGWDKILESDAGMWAEAKRTAADGPKILIGSSVPGFAAHSMVESIVAVALTLRGANVTMLSCDQTLPACMRAEMAEVTDPATIIDGHFNQHRVCMECPQVGRVLFDPLGLSHRKFGEFVSLAERKEISQVAEGLSLAEMPAFTWRGLPVGEHAYAGVLRYYASGDLSHEPTAAGVAQKYLEGTMISAAAVQQAVRENLFDGAFLDHGIYSPQGMVAEVCRQAGLPISVWHVAYRKRAFMVSHEDTYHRTMLTEPVEAWEDVEWTADRDVELMTYLKSRWSGSNDWIWFHENPVENIEKISEEIGVDLRKPTVGLLTNVMWDAQLHYGTNAYPNMLEWILDTIDYFSKRSVLQLLIRVHPAEIRGTMPSRQSVIGEVAARWPKLPANVFIIPPESNVSTYAAMEQCDSVLIYATKTGVELSAMGVPVVVAGEAWIRNKGFSMDAVSPASHRAIMDTLPLGNRLDEAQIIRAKKYAYHFFFRRMIPMGFMAPADNWPPYQMEINGLSDLMPGKDAGLDLICEGILTGTPYVYPAENLGYPEK